MDKPLVYPEPAIGCGRRTSGQTDVPVQSIVVSEILPANLFDEASKRADVSFNWCVSPSTATFRQHKGVELLYYSLRAEELEADMSSITLRWRGTIRGRAFEDGLKISKCF